ncbi:MAG TPA: cyclic nucleotide-binding domain-containing protein [Pseudomonadales bacterium]|nr:cyclic nucleotide-binding domain-containing protein [Pseudomonadales bacterium]
MLRETPVFEQLDADDLSLIASHLIELSFEPGDLVFREGAPGGYICFVTSGVLDVSKRIANGDDVIIAEIGSGRSVGEMSIIDGLTCSATVTARGETRVLALTRNDFDRLVEATPRLGSEVFRGISRLLSVSLRKTSEDLAAERARAK